MEQSTTQRWVLGLTSASALMAALDQVVVSTALTTMQRDLHASLATLAWTVNAYTLSFAVLLMTASALGDRYGRRRLLVAGLAVFTVGSAACALSTDAAELVAARAVQGAGAAAVMPQAMAMLTSAFPPQQRGRALGVFSALLGLAVVGGPLAGGAVTQGLAWQWVFWLNVPIGLAVTPLVRARTPETRGPAAALDLPGLALSVVALGGLVLALVRGTDAGWTSAPVAAGLVLGAAGLAGFVVRELRAPAPLLPLRLFRDRAFAAGNLTTFLLYASLTASVFFVAQWFQVARGAGPLGAGLRLLPWTAPLFVSAPLAGVLSDRFGPRRLVCTGLLLQAAGLAAVALVARNHLGYAAAAPAFVVAGAGVTAAMPALQSAVLGAVPPTALGKASGTFNTLRQLGAAFGVAALAGAFSAGGGYGSAASFDRGFAAALTVAAALSLVAAATGLLLAGHAPSKNRPAVPERQREAVGVDA